MKDCITTYSKVFFPVLNPENADIRMVDIAHALSLLTRAGGHYPEFYSVAQHCIDCYNEAKARNYDDRVALGCLLHDASEAYIADVTRPVKRNMTMYLQIEKQLQDEIYRRFMTTLPNEEESKLIANIDDACLYFEFDHFMGQKLMEEEPVLISEPTFEIRPHRDVEKEFLSLTQALLGENQS